MGFNITVVSAVEEFCLLLMLADFRGLVADQYAPLFTCRSTENSTNVVVTSVNVFPARSGVQSRAKRNKNFFAEAECIVLKLKIKMRNYDCRSNVRLL